MVNSTAKMTIIDMMTMVLSFLWILCIWEHYYGDKGTNEIIMTFEHFWTLVKSQNCSGTEHALMELNNGAK